MSRWIWSTVTTLALIGAFTVILIGAASLLSGANAGEAPDPWREIRALNRAIQTLQEVNNKQSEEIDILRSIPATKEQYDKEKRKRDRERR